MRRSRALGAAAVWIVLVAGCGVLVWLAINRAGDSVVAGPLAPAVSSTPTQTTTRPGVTDQPGITSTDTSGATASPPVPTPEAGSVQVTGGRVGVSCLLDSLSLEYATPLDGWSFETETRGDELEVTFESGHVESAVHVTCSGGRPVFEVHDDDE